jgi:hypothetical protein
MDIRKKLRLLGFFQPVFPLWVLKRQAEVVHHAFAADLAEAKAKKDTEGYEHLRGQQQFETTEYLDELRAIQSGRLLMEAQNLYIYVPDLKWEHGPYGHMYLDRESESKLYHAVKEQKYKMREYRLKLASAITGIIGALIGLVAVWKKK